MHMKYRKPCDLHLWTFYFKEQGRWESENFSFVSADMIQLHVSKFLANLGHIFKSNMNVRNASKASHCRMLFPLDTGDGTSRAVRFYQFKMWETCLLLTIQFTFHRLKERQAVSFHCLSKQRKNWRRGKFYFEPNFSTLTFSMFWLIYSVWVISDLCKYQFDDKMVEI